jgi:hypothetical protein
MRLTILALSFAGLCVPGIALAQGSTAEVMRTTPGAHCTGDIVASQCTLTNPQYAAGNLAGSSGTTYNTTPAMTGATSTTGTTGGGTGVLSPTPPSGSLGTGGGSMGGGSSGGSSGGY